jgi:hypothetical protein
VSSRAKGAHRSRPDVVGADPQQQSGPQRWVVSLGVLGVVAGICTAGVLVLGDGGGDGGAAAVRQMDDPASSPQPSRWSAVALQPGGAGGQASLIGNAGAASAPGAAPLTATGTPDPGPGTSDPGSGTGVAADRPPRGLAGSGSATASSTTSGTPFGAGSMSGFTEQSDGAGIPSVTASRSTSATTGRAAAASAVRTSPRRVGTGRLAVVPGTARAPGAGGVMRVSVEVEQGTGVDGPAFARFVMDTLNAPESWGRSGALTFARTAGAADFRVILAGAPTARRLCASHAGNQLSCGGGTQAVLDLDQWLDGVPAYAGDLTGFRRWAVNHEVGHVLGHANGFCDPGHLAPVMVQQSLGLHGCRRNPWPYPRG